MYSVFELSVSITFVSPCVFEVFASVRINDYCAECVPYVVMYKQYTLYQYYTCTELLLEYFRVCIYIYHLPQLCLFAEGTRFTEEKHAQSVEFARSRGLPILKHHLFPRTKGFCFLMKELYQSSQSAC